MLPAESDKRVATTRAFIWYILFNAEHFFYPSFKTSRQAVRYNKRRALLLNDCIFEKYCAAESATSRSTRVTYEYVLRFAASSLVCYAETLCLFYHPFKDYGPPGDDCGSMKKGFMNTAFYVAPKKCSESKHSVIKHDESGQVFSEISCPGGPMTSDWLWQTQGEAARFRPSGPGCSSLVDMAIRSTLSHSSNITAESLQGLPWKVAELLWVRLVASYAHFDPGLVPNSSNDRSCTDN